MREALGSPNVDSRISRGPDRDTLLRLADPGISARVRDIDAAAAVLVVGTDPLHTSPILDLRIRKAIRRNGTRLAVATDRPTALDGGAEAVVRYTPGALRGLPRGAVPRRSATTPTTTPPPIAEVLRGRRERRHRLGRAVGPGWRGAVRALLDVAGQLRLADEGQARDCSKFPSCANARGLREAGCLPDAGPGLVETDAGRGTEEIRAALQSGELKTLVLFGVDPLRDFPDTEAWKGALAAADHLVVFSTFENQTTAMADVVFPIETYAEKDGTVTHPEGRLQRVRPSASRPGDIRPNWGVLAELSLALGHDTGVSSQPTAFEALTEAVPFYAGITDARDRRTWSSVAGPA